MTKNHIIGLTLGTICLVAYFLLVYRINNPAPHIRQNAESLVSAHEKEFLSVFTTTAPIDTTTMLNTTALFYEYPGISIPYPDTWVYDFDDTNVVIHDQNGKNCIHIYYNKDNKPLLEAKNFSPFMQTKGKPFQTKDEIETTVHKMPAVISTLNINNSWVDNVIIKTDLQHTLVIRTCNENKEFFYSILQGLQKQ